MDVRTVYRGRLMALRDGERQVAPTLGGIRPDHTARYRWAARIIRTGSRVIDFACGVGYGSYILAQAGNSVLAFDKDPEAIEYGNKHWRHPNIEFRIADASAPFQIIESDVAVCFETIEHLADPLVLLRSLRSAKTLLASVPNEDVFPYRNYKFHHRHYTKDEFERLLNAAGFEVSEWLGQVDEKSDVSVGVSGRTLVALAKRSKRAKARPVHEVAAKVAAPRRDAPGAAKSAPATVAILGMGPSLNTFIDIVKCLGGTHKLCDEVWGINALGDVLRCDRVFHMDDIRVQELRAGANPDGNIAAMLPWMRKHPGPIYTSVAHPDYPGLVEYPLADVLNSCSGQRYFNSTAAYAVAYAVHLGVRKIICAGMDFSYGHSHQAEKGRGNVEFWLGFARARGIDIAIVRDSTLLDACVAPEDRLYGYDGVRVDISGPLGSEKVSFSERPLPTAEEIEARYDHSQPTVPEHLREP